MKKTLSVIIFLIVILAVFYFWQLKQDNKIAEQTTGLDFAISFEFEPGNTTQVPYSWVSDKSLFAITKDIAQEQNWVFNFEDYGEMGLLVTQIYAKENGDNNMYWQYFVDGEQAMVSVDKLYPEDGSQIEWKFMKSEF